MVAKNHKPYGFWSKKECHIDALKFQTIKVWRKSSAGAYDKAYSMGWIEECTSHMYKFSKKKGYWTFDRCFDDVKKYNTIKEWRINSTGYTTAKNNKWIEKCSMHMRKIGNLKLRMIYAFEFPNKSVYVGLTYDIDKRKKEHLNPLKKVKTAVYNFKIATGLVPNLIILTDYIAEDNAIKMENEYINKYKIEGWNILNKAKGGALGGNQLKWTKEICMLDAKKYNNRTLWTKNSPGAIDASYRNGWINDCCEHMTK